MDIEELRLKREKLKKEQAEMDTKLDLLIDESRRVTNVAKNAATILDNLDYEFERRIELHGKDLSFVFVATGVLCIKWVILQAVMPMSFDFEFNPSSSDQRLNSTEMGYIDTKGKNLEEYQKTLDRVKKNHEKMIKALENCDEETRIKIEKSIKNNEKRQKELNKVISFIMENDDARKEIEKLEKRRTQKLADVKDETTKYRSVKDILLKPVPYDAMSTVSPTCVLPVTLVGTNHHAYTLGHDPILGWVFGTMNIMSSSISLNYPNYPVYWVVEGNKIKCKTNWILFIMSCINSAKEDPKRIGAATLRQGLHMLSDKYGKTGLPLSFAMRTPEEAQELIDKGWNSEELKKYISKIEDTLKKNLSIVAIQCMLSFLINQIVYAMYLMQYDEKKDGPIELYKVKANRILSVANTISTTSNYAYAIITKKLSSLDVGGAIETIRLIIQDHKYRRRIKEEFIRNSFFDLISNSESEFNWLIDNN